MTVKRRSLAIWLPVIPVAWVTLAAVLAWARTGTLSSRIDGVLELWTWQEIFNLGLYAYVWWMPLGSLVVWATWRMANTRLTTATRLLWHVVMGIAIVAANFLLRASIALPGDRLHPSFAWLAFRSTLPSSLALYLMLLAGALAAVGYQRARNRERERGRIALHASRLETELAEAQLGVLRAQLHPHFLFNSLNAIAALIDWQPVEARRMLVQLSELLRLAVEFSAAREVPLAREVEWVEHYLDLQDHRFADRLAVDLRVPSEVADALVPPLILQPLVENAIRHAAELRNGPSHITITAGRQQTMLHLCVSDNGPGLSTSTTRTSGVGLRNTGDRLRTLYGAHQSVRLQNRETGGADAIVELPYHTEPMPESFTRP